MFATPATRAARSACRPRPRSTICSAPPWRNVFPDADPDALASAGWAMAHGMAYLHMDGKLAARSPEEVADRVRTAFSAIAAHAHPTDPPRLTSPRGVRP